MISTNTTIMLIVTCGCIAMVVMGIIAEWRLRSPRLNQAEKNKEAWKSLALALEALQEVQSEYEEEMLMPRNEGCMKRSRRREHLRQQIDNAVMAAGVARDQLINCGEYE